MGLGSGTPAPRTPPPHTRPPGIIRAAAAAWLVAAVLVAVAGISFIVSARTQHQDSAALTMMGALALVLAALSAYSVLRLRAGKRSARETLSSIGVIAGFPLLFRGPALVAVGLVLLACTALLWLPQSSRYFQIRDPKKRAAKGRRPR
ncbi:MULTISPECIES: hypothetical protein [Arthrobacter]|uniref:hypothetical protein n=1 Tax=Arthrobacter TaxID=1663 RepID=UPI002107125D|nr:MULTISPECIES: hypothetical protein [Arthrobacter]MCQ1952524.1 hypothetical protein [Arthrobacter sp. zg-Y238]MCQ1955354.1 hypothetical protein [Arthrobacter jinronghuae]